MTSCDELEKLYNELKELKTDFDKAVNMIARDSNMDKLMADKEEIEELRKKLRLELFLEGKESVERFKIEIGGKDKDQLIKEMEEKNIDISDGANQLLDSKDFTTSKKAESADLVKITVEEEV